MSKILIGPPIFRKFYSSAAQLAMILLKFRFESGKERECVCGRACKPGEYLFVEEPSDLAGGGFHYRPVEGDLTVGGHCDLFAAPDDKHCCRADQRRTV